MASLVIAGVLLLAMIVASGRAAVTLPAQARIPVHFGSVEHCYLAPKRAGLVIWPAVGAVLFGTVGGITGSSMAADWVPGVRDVLTPAVMGVALAFQIGALVLARRRAPPRVCRQAVNNRAVRLVGPYHLEVPLTGGMASGTVGTGRLHEDRQQPGPGNAGPAAR